MIYLSSLFLRRNSASQFCLRFSFFPSQPVLFLPSLSRLVFPPLFSFLSNKNLISIAQPFDRAYASINGWYIGPRTKKHTLSNTKWRSWLIPSIQFSIGVLIKKSNFFLRQRWWTNQNEKICSKNFQQSNSVKLVFYSIFAFSERKLRVSIFSSQNSSFSFRNTSFDRTNSISISTFGSK